MPLSINSNKTVTQITTTTKSPCEIPKKKSNEKIDQDSSEKKEETTTKKPKMKINSRRRRQAERSPSLGNKRCIADLFAGFRRDSILGAQNPNAADCDRYESENEVASSNAEAKTIVVDNDQVEASVLQASPTTKQLLGGMFTKSLKSFKKLPKKTENLPISVESNEIFKKIEEPEPFSAPQFSTYQVPSYQPSNYLPSFEFFPKNRPISQDFQDYPSQDKPSAVVGPSSFKTTHYDDKIDFSAPSFSPNQPQFPQHSLPTHDKSFVIGPSSFKSTSFSDVGSQHEISHTLKHHTDKTVSSDCRCDPEHFDDLLHHMESSYTQFHNGMNQLFDTFKSQTNCGSKDSTSSHSNFDYNVHCHDKNAINADSELSKLCQKAFIESGVEPSGGFYKPPGASDVKTGGFKNQFLSYTDYLKMMQNVNSNSGTVLSSSNDINDDIVSASQKLLLPDDDSQENTANQLRQHFSQFQDETVAAEVAAAPEPSEEKSPLRFQIKSFLPEFMPRIKI